MGFAKLSQSMLEAHDIKLIDSEDADTALRASGMTREPWSRALGGICQRMIDDLHELAIGCWSAHGHSVSIP
jgi:hypothetical protein